MSFEVVTVVQNGAKFNRSLKRWELPPGSNPTARMGVQGEEGKPSQPPLGQKAAALQKDAERKVKAARPSSMDMYRSSGQNHANKDESSRDIIRLSLRLDMIDNSTALAKKYKRLGMTKEYEQEIEKTKKLKAEFDASLSGYEKRLMEVLPSKSKPKSAQANTLLEKEFKVQTQQPYSHSQIRVLAALTPKQIAARYGKDIGNEFGRYAERSGLYWKDKRTGQSFNNLGEALTRELLEHDRARKLLGQKQDVTPDGTQ